MNARERDWLALAILMLVPGIPVAGVLLGLWLAPLLIG